MKSHHRLAMTVFATAIASPCLSRIFTIKSFSSAHAVRATDARHGIDHRSTNNSTTCAVQSISVPILIAGMGGRTRAFDRFTLLTIMG